MKQILNSYIDLLNQMHNHQHVPDPHEIFEARMEKFKFAIKKFKHDQLRIINDKADREEEFQLNKIKKEASNKNEDVFKRMEDNIKVAEKIFKSRKLNECRMSEMKVRFDMIEKVQLEAKAKLKTQRSDSKVYKALLKELIKQGLIKLLEQEVEIRCLREDEALVREVIGACERQFNEQCEVQTKVSISDRNYLADADLGGVILTSLKGRIVCDNTLRARLSYCLQLLLPEIRDLLFHDSDLYLAQRRKEKKEADLQKRKAQAAVEAKTHH